MNLSQNALSRRSFLHAGAMAGAGTILAGFPLGEVLARSLAKDGKLEAAWPTVAGLVDKYVSQRKVAGMVAALGWGDAKPGFIERGKEGYDDPDAAGPESLYRAYSQTKPITGMAAMMLIDEGKLKLDQPIADFAPELARMKVAIDPDKGLDARPTDVLITVRHLLTHTAGFGYAGIGVNKPIAKELEHRGLIPAIVTDQKIPGLSGGPATPDPDEFLRRTAEVPLCFEPGKYWRYSMSLDVLGIIIQRASGAKSFGHFLQERIFDPLDMKHSFFLVPGKEARHLTTNYGILAGSQSAIDKPASSIYLRPTPFAYGGSGLVTSPADFDRFLAMLVNSGRHRGRKVMSEAAVAIGTSDLLPPGVDLTGTWVNGQAFGAGGFVGTGKNIGWYGWSGAAGTIGLCNVRNKLRTGLYVQYMPSNSYPLWDEFTDAVAKDVTAMGKAAA